MRITRVLRQTSADPFKTHVGDRSPFWKKVRETLAVSPTINTGSPVVLEHRWPQPASRPEKFTVPASKASDVAANPYWQRDFRRSYPTTAVVTQSELAQLLISQGGFTSLPAPSLDSSASKALTTSGESLSLASVYSATSAPAASFKPPTPPTLKIRWFPSTGENVIPSNPDADFPMVAYSAEKA